MRDTCHNCTDRVLLCHSTCERYLTAKAELAVHKELQRKHNSIKHEVSEVRRRSIQHMTSKKLGGDY